MFFGKGWQGFIDDNVIEFGDLLVFKLYGQSKFYIRIYGKTCCEKESIVEKTCRRKEKQGIVNGKFVERTSPGKNSCESAIMKNRKVTNREKNKALAHGFKMKTRSSHQGGQTAKPDESGTAVKKKALLPQVAKGYLTKSIANIRTAVTPQQKRAYEAANQFKSDYPFFIIKLSKSCIKERYMDLPMGFVRSYLPDESKCCEIIDVKGRTWLAKYNRPNFKKGSICAGWSVVILENDLDEDHVCAFQASSWLTKTTSN